MASTSRKIDESFVCNTIASVEQNKNNNADVHTLFTMLTHHFETMNSYNSLSHREDDAVQNINWSNLNNLMKDGAYYTPKAMANRLGVDEAAILKLISANKSKLHSPKVRSLKNGQRYYVLKHKRDKMLEMIWPAQNALKEIFG